MLVKSLIWAASSFVQVPSCIRQVQFLPTVDGILILPSSPTSRYSCIGITTVYATDMRAVRIMASGIFLFWLTFR